MTGGDPFARMANRYPEIGSGRPGTASGTGTCAGTDVDGVQHADRDDAAGGGGGGEEEV